MTESTASDLGRCASFPDAWKYFWDEYIQKCLFCSGCNMQEHCAKLCAEYYRRVSQQVSHVSEQVTGLDDTERIAIGIVVPVLGLAAIAGAMWCGFKYRQSRKHGHAVRPVGYDPVAQEAMIGQAPAARRAGQINDSGGKQGRPGPQDPRGTAGGGAVPDPTSPRQPATAHPVQETHPPTPELNERDGCARVHLSDNVPRHAAVQEEPDTKLKEHY